MRARSRTPIPLVLACMLGGAIACGESRRPIGQECLRDADCLSDVCAARTCVSAPALVTGAGEPPGEEEPLIPTSDAANPIVDAGAEGS